MLDVSAGRMIIILPSGLEKMQVKYDMSIMIDTKPKLLESSTAPTVSSGGIQKRIAALKVITEQIQMCTSEEDKNAFLKCYDIVSAGIREAISN